MKTIKKSLSIALVILVVMSCSLLQKTSSDKFMTSSIVPAAEGTVQIKKDKNNNYNIKINIWNLADPGKLDPAKNHYVVWMESKEDNAKVLGQIKPEKSISKVLKASIQTVSPIKPTRIFISAEDDPEVTQPVNQVVLTTDELK